MATWDKLEVWGFDGVILLALVCSSMLELRDAWVRVAASNAKLQYDGVIVCVWGGKGGCATVINWFDVGVCAHGCSRGVRMDLVAQSCQSCLVVGFGGPAEVSSGVDGWDPSQPIRPFVTVLCSSRGRANRGRATAAATPRPAGWRPNEVNSPLAQLPARR